MEGRVETGVTDLDVALCVASLVGVVIIAPYIPVPELTFRRLFLLVTMVAIADAAVISLRAGGVADVYAMVGPLHHPVHPHLAPPAGAHPIPSLIVYGPRWCIHLWYLFDSDHRAV